MHSAWASPRPPNSTRSSPRKRASSRHKARKFACRLIAERLLNEPLDLLDGIETIERGKAMEPDAVAQYEFAEEIETQPIGFVTTDDGLVGASPDRLIVGASAGLEIKCPLLPTHIGYRLDGPGDDYRPQVQGQLWVAEFEWLDFYSYHPQMEPVRLRTQRDDAYIKLIEQALRDFNDMLHDMYERVRPAFFAGLPSNAFDGDPVLPPMPQSAELALYTRSRSGPPLSPHAESPLLRIAPAARQPVDDLVGVVGAPETAVVTLQRAGIVAALLAQVVAEDRGAHAHVVGDADQLLVAHAELTRPERHDLHETHGSGGRHRVTVKAALDVHDGEHEIRRNVDAARLAMNVVQNLLALFLVLDVTREPRPHRREPQRAIVLVVETAGRGNDLGEHAAQLGIHLPIRQRAGRPQHQQGCRDEGDVATSRASAHGLSD